MRLRSAVPKSAKLGRGERKLAPRKKHQVEPGEAARIHQGVWTEELEFEIEDSERPKRA